MKILIGSYNENIYEVEVNLKTNKFTSSTIFKNVGKPSYIIPFDNDYAFIHIKDNIQYVRIKDQDISLGNDTSCHLSYDEKNKLFYSSHYHSGNLYVLSENNDNSFEVLDKYQYTENSHIHFAMYIPTLDLLGVCDLGDNKLHLYEVINEKLVLKTSFTFEKGTGPRHFSYHKNLPLIYVICEHSGEIITLQYKDETLSNIQQVDLPKGASSAIRISKESTHLYAADRISNTISTFEIIEDGLLIKSQTISTQGDHPRDFNLSFDERFLVVANMNSNNLTLYERDAESGSLILLDENFELNSGASVLFI
ncbi:MAG TPA: lactonase family protein [Acholeplasmataceae bacterium]|nr:lactonase family protein [Acholeplasmataceae bacterium]